MAGPNVRAIVELNDMTYCNHYEILVDLLRRSKPPSSMYSALPMPAAALEGHGGNCTGLAVDQPHRNSNDATDFSPNSTSGEFGNYTLSATSIAPFRRGNSQGEGGGGGGRTRRSWWRRLFGAGDGLPPPGGEEACGSQGLRQHRPSTRGSTASSSAMPSTTGAAAATVAEAAESATRATEGRRGRAHWTLTKGVASGAIVPSSLPEALLCQAFYNPAIIMIVEALLDPKGQGCGKQRGNEKDDLRQVERDHEGSCNDDTGDAEYRGGGGREGDRGGGEASFLAQILPPKQFFKQAMHGGHRPNFQVRCSYPPPQSVGAQWAKGGVRGGGSDYLDLVRATQKFWPRPCRLGKFNYDTGVEN